jgi:hypothetical protein
MEVSNAYTWQQLNELHDTIVDIKIPREPQVLREYVAYAETDEYKEFGFHTILKRVRSRGDRVLMGDHIDDITKQGLSYFIIMRNDFPYHLEHGVYHYVVWFVPGTSTDGCSIPRDDVFILYRYLGAIMGSRERLYCVFQNSINVRSICTVLHAQLFTRGIQLQECVIPCLPT